MDRSTVAELTQLFGPQARERGEAYFRRGAVRIAEATTGRVLATVEGSRRYTVELLFRERKTAMACSCPDFLESDTPCRHLWAVILRLESASFFTGGYRFPEEGRRGEAGGEALRVFRSGPAAAEPQLESPSRALPLPSRKAPPLPGWKRALQSLRGAGLMGAVGRPDAARELFYVLDVERSREADRLILLPYERPAGSDRTPQPIDPRGVPADSVAPFTEGDEREVLAVLAEWSLWTGGAPVLITEGSLPRRIPMLLPRYSLDREMAGLLIPKICRCGRCLLMSDEGRRLDAVAVDEGPPWEFGLSLATAGSAKGWAIEGGFARKGESIGFGEVVLAVDDCLFIARGRLSRCSAAGRTELWISALRRTGAIEAGASELGDLVRELLGLPGLPSLSIAASVPLRAERADPLPRLRVRSAESVGCSKAGGSLVGEPSFDYAGRVAGEDDPPSGLFFEEEGLVLFRDAAAERRHLERLIEVGFHKRYDSHLGRRLLKLAERRLPEIVPLLLEQGWQVEADAKVYRRASRIDFSVSSGIDWFEARGGADFDDQHVALPELLKAVRRGRNTVLLGDGSYGLLPEQWLKRQGLALAFGEPNGEAVRYRSSQALLVDLLLPEEGGRDEDFERFRRRISEFGGVQAADAPPGFTGSLRGYQREGLGWFRFLDEFGFGGCLADDMGLGKTVQLLALLEARREERGGESGPASLVVVPKSLAFNWKAEAARFTPSLSILDYTGPERGQNAGRLEDYDVVLTTYGTLRNDIGWMRAVVFDYIVLDEAQAIKNPNSVTAKAVRLLRGRRRLALSGTPVENHLGELWSLFEFLNPGMLGGVSVFARSFASHRDLDEPAARLLSRALRPFILRRTKSQVAPELPAKIEQTVYCELSPPERRRYEELRDYYRAALDRRIRSEGFGRAKIHILEALLRLRQAACDPALLDGNSRARPGAKLGLLLEQLEEVVAEGRKALVFSQFTSLLALLRRGLERGGLSYEYLDGQTRDREARVRRFQEDPSCPLFLISLKAGGLGLNLTAAEYVFILDPWWNPAAEAQAIDRAHRIGQERTVFAYRLIAKDTVEEKVLALQESKRSLAEAIITEDNRLIDELTQEDLSLLLS